MADFAFVLLEEEVVVIVAVGVAADVDFRRFAGLEGVSDSLDDDGVDDERAGGSGGGTDFSWETFEFKAGVAVDAAVVDGEVGDVGKNFASGMA